MSYHGIALNVTVDLADFDLIDPCGMPGVTSTSIAAERGETDGHADDAIRGARGGHLRRGIRCRAWRAADRDLTMAAGLFELRKDPITGWWVATVVDRAFHRDRFARAAEPIDDRLFGCANCSTPEGDGVRVRMLKDFAFHVVGTGDDARELDTRARPGGARAGARDGELANDRRAARRASAAPRGRQRDDRVAGRRRARGARGGPQPGPDRLPPGRPELGRPGRRADQPPVPRPVRPATGPAPDRRGDGRRGPLRHPRGGVPVLPPRPRRIPAP